MRARLGARCDVLGYLLTMYDRREKITTEVEKILRRNFGAAVFADPIRVNTRHKAAPSHKKTIFEFEGKSGKGRSDYEQLVDGVLARLDDAQRAQPSACRKSSTRSPASSIPTDSRNSPSVMPKRRRSMSDSLLCEKRRRMRHQRRHVAERRRARDQPQPIVAAPRARQPARDLEADHRAAAVEHARRDLVIGMRRQRRMSARARRRRSCSSACATVSADRHLPLHAQRHRAQPAQRQPRRERIGVAAGQLAQLAHLGDLALRPRDDAEQQIAVPADVLGRRVHAQDRAALDRPLQERRREGRVDDERHAARATDRGDAVEIGDAQKRIRDRLQVHDARLGLDRGVDRLRRRRRPPACGVAPKRGRCSTRNACVHAVEPLDADDVPAGADVRQRAPPRSRPSPTRKCTRPRSSRARRWRAPSRSSVGLASRE